MILSEEELFPGGGGAIIAEFGRQRKHDGRLVQVAEMVGHEKHWSIDVFQLLKPPHFERSETSEQGTMKHGVPGLPDPPEEAVIGPEPEMVMMGQLFPFCNDLAQVRHSCLRPDL